MKRKAANETVFIEKLSDREFELKKLTVKCCAKLVSCALYSQSCPEQRLKDLMYLKCGASFKFDQ